MDFEVLYEFKSFSFPNWNIIRCGNTSFLHKPRQNRLAPIPFFHGKTCRIFMNTYRVVHLHTPDLPFTSQK